jgi:dTDP-4-dehydrorhamnose reductase
VTTRWLVTGAAGMLGRDVLSELTGREVTAADRRALDVTDAAAVLAAVAGHQVVVNCAAFTAVDDAEAQEAQAFAVNAVGAANLARACAATGGSLVHVSTDYVFSGDADRPYPEDAPLAPRSAYGRTKAAGEWAVRAELPRRHWILRTAWLYGEHGGSFVRTMARLERTRENVDVVDDQHGQPTWSRDAARRIVQVVDSAVPAGTYHASSAGATTWFGLARAVFALLGTDPDRVRPTTSAAFARPAPRPAWSVLGHGRWATAGLPPLRAWDEALAEAIASGRVVDGAPVSTRLSG